MLERCRENELQTSVLVCPERLAMYEVHGFYSYLDKELSNDTDALIFKEQN